MDTSRNIHHLQQKLECWLSHFAVREALGWSLITD